MIGSGTRAAGVLRSVSLPESIDGRLRAYCLEHNGSVEMLIRNAVRHYVTSGTMMRDHYVRIAARQGLSLNFHFRDRRHYAVVGGREPGQPIPEGERDIATLFAVRTFPDAIYVSEGETGITFEVDALHRTWTDVA